MPPDDKYHPPSAGSLRGEAESTEPPLPPPPPPPPSAQQEEEERERRRRQQQERLNAFYARHFAQFQAIGLPQALHGLVCMKILSQIFDAGASFVFKELESDEEEEEESDKDEKDMESDEKEEEKQEEQEVELSDEERFVPPSRKYSLLAKEDIKAHGDAFLIDHMWTTTFPQSRRHLREIEGLAERIDCMLGSEARKEGKEREGEEDPQTLVGRVWERIWPHLNCYLVPGEDYPKWYLMDEVGTAVSHSWEPNCVCYPLLIFPEEGENVRPFTLSLLWPVKDIAEGEEVTRDYLPSVEVGPRRELRMLGFMSKDDVYRTHACHHLQEISLRIQHADDYVGQPLTGHPSGNADTLEGWSEPLRRLESAKQGSITLKLYCDDHRHINSLVLSSPRFHWVESAAEADILFLINHTFGQDQEEDKNGKILNQFSWDGMLVSKEHLAATLQTAKREVQRQGPLSSSLFPPQLGLSEEEQREIAQMFLHLDDWLPPSYNLSQHSQLVAFLIDYFGFPSEGESEGRGSETKPGEENIWILKRFRGQQSIDYPVTSSLSCILRHLETCPRLACRYITQPALYQGRKFDLRYYIAVHSLQPVKVYRHRLFNIRAANQAYTTSDLESYQTHFTVMNYLDEQGLKEIRGEGTREDPLMDEFIRVFEGENPGTSWESDVQPLIDKVMKSVFLAVPLTIELQPPHPSGRKLHLNGVKALPTFWDEMLCGLYLEDYGGNFVQL